MEQLCSNVTPFNLNAIHTLEYSIGANYINILMNYFVQLKLSKSKHRTTKAGVFSLSDFVAPHWLTHFGQTCWLAVPICAISPTSVRTAFITVFVSRFSSKLQQLWIRMLCYILLGNYIECCTSNWINSSFIWISIKPYTTRINLLHIWITFTDRTYHHYRRQMEFKSGK